MADFLSLPFVVAHHCCALPRYICRPLQAFLSSSTRRQLFAIFRSEAPHSTHHVSSPALVLERFEIDPQTGFVLPQSLPTLQGDFQQWEIAFARAKDGLILGALEDDSGVTADQHDAALQWRTNVDDLPILSVESLMDDVNSMRRAHQVLAFLAHFYVHSAPSSGQADKRVPRSLAMPLVQVSKALDIAPILTFADSVLWNVEARVSRLPMTAFNIKATNLFSGTEDESAFYCANAGVELQGAEILKNFVNFHAMAEEQPSGSINRMADALSKLGSLIGDLREILEAVQNTCDPHIFYWVVRPWLDGGDFEGDRWTYEGVENSPELDISGPSGAQSPLVHALDVFLDVDHGNARQSSGDFLARMRRYMPRSQQAFLRHLETSTPRVRDMAQTHEELRAPYDAAVESLKAFRESHMRIVARYVLRMSRTSSGSRARCPMMRTAHQDAAATTIKGTGGTNVQQVLSATREATRKSLLKAQVTG